MTLHSGLLSTLVLLALLLCLGTDVHAAPDPIVEAIQRTLVERGYDPGAIDGAMGWRTRGALRQFQRSVGLPATGRTDDATLAALGMKPRTGAEPEPEADTDTPKAEAPRAEPDTVPSTDTPQAEAPRAEPETMPGTDTPQAEAPRAEPDTMPSTDTPQAEAPRAESDTMPSTDTPQAEAPRAESDAMPSTDTPQAEAPRAEPDTMPGTDTPQAEAPRAEPDTMPGTDTPQAEAPRAEPDTMPGTDAPQAEAPRAEPDTMPSTDTPQAEAPRAEPAPVRTAGPRLSFATLGWHPPQTGAEALARFDAIGAPPEFKRGTGALFVPKGEFVFVLQAGERIPGLDCDPGAGRLSIEFVFGPDGPVIFTPVAGGEYCQTGIGIAIGVGRTLEIRRVDWGDMQYPQGTVRVTDRGLEYAR